MSRCAFALEYLIGVHEQRSLRTPRAALAALGDYDPVLAAQWRVLLERTEDPTRLGGLSLSDLDGSDDLPSLGRGDLAEPPAACCHDVPLSERNVAAAVLAGCKARLLGRRRDALEALREGFVGFVDLSVQLAPLPTSELQLMVQGRVCISAQQLDECFDWGAEASPPFPPRSNALLLFRAFVRNGLTPPQRLQLLRWCTAQNALPMDGLKEKVTFKHFVGSGGGDGGGGGGDGGRDAAADERLPVAHTCSYEVELPGLATRLVHPYTSSAYAHEPYYQMYTPINKPPHRWSCPTTRAASGSGKSCCARCRRWRAAAASLYSERGGGV